MNEKINSKSVISFSDKYLTDKEDMSNEIKTISNPNKQNREYKCLKLLKKFSLENLHSDSSTILQNQLLAFFRVHEYPNLIGTKTMAKHHNSENNTFFSEGYLTKKGVRSFIGGDYPISSSTLRAWIKFFGFPAPIYLTHKTPVWEKAKILDWIKSRRAGKASEGNYEAD